MPLGSFRINGIAKRFAVQVEAEGIRRKVGVVAIGDAKVSTAESQFGGASYFSASRNTNKLVATEDGNFNYGTNDFTFEGWFRFNSNVNDTLTLFDQRQSTTGAGRLAPSLFVNANKFRYFADGAYRITGTTAVATNTWYHVALSRSNGTSRLFVNGVQESSNFTDTFDFASRDLHLGGRFALSGSSFLAVPGYMDELRVSKTARYTSNFTPATTPFVNDESTLLLLHMDGTNDSTVFEDDNGVRNKVGVTAIGDAKVSTAQSQFGGSSAIFDGSGDSLRIDQSPTLPAGSTFTIEAWVRNNGSWSSVEQHIYRDQQVAYSIRNGRVAIFRNPSWTTGPSAAILSDNTWHHVAWVSNGSIITGYLNGVAVVSRSTTASIGTFANIGSNNAAASGFHNGYIDELRVSNTARYTSNFTPSTTPFVNDANTLLLLHMDGTNNSTYFEDDNGVRSKVGVSAFGDAKISTAESQFGGSSALFDGSATYIQTAAVPEFEFGTGNFTIEARIYLNNTNEMTIIDSRAQTSGANNLRVRNSKLSWSNASVWLQGSTTLNINTWYYVAVSRNNGNLRLWVNGNIDLDVTENVNITAGSTKAARIGISYGNGAQFNGYIDELRVSDTARYTSNFTPPTEPFQNDSNTLLLLHMDGTNNSTTFTDDNGVPPDFDYGT
jgi:uncharacterized protein YaiE (UPF0345 family)